MSILFKDKRRAGLLIFSSLILSLILAVFALRTEAAPPNSIADPAFTNLWKRTDPQVRDGFISRSYLWGPEPFTPGLNEDYVESGKRLVQYFDKTRMEINDPGGDPNSPYYVTNGLLVRELISGQLQLGDRKFENRAPANIGVGGDPDDSTGPTYATLGRLTFPAQNRVGKLVFEAVTRDSTVIKDQVEYANNYLIVNDHFETTTQHNIPSPFWVYLNQNGPIVDSTGLIRITRLFDPIFYATGLPITEAYWSKVLVGGSLKDVLVQAFERRILTYTPSNVGAFQVQMGNVGRHYYAWRYANSQPRIAPTVISFPSLPPQPLQTLPPVIQPSPSATPFPTSQFLPPISLSPQATPVITVGITTQPQPTETVEPTAPPEATLTPRPTATIRPTATPTRTPAPSPTVTPLPTATATPSPTVTPTPTQPIVGSAPAVDCLSAISTSGDVVQACVDDPMPALNSDVQVLGRLIVGGRIISGVEMKTSWRYEATTTFCNGVAGADGVARCTQNIGTATRNVTVVVTVNFTYNGRTYTTRADFTPQ